jgi:hypothetical protein
MNKSLLYLLISISLVFSIPAEASVTGIWFDGQLLSSAHPLPITCSANGVSVGCAATFGTAFPTNGNAIGVKNGGNLVALNGDVSGNAGVDIYGINGTVLSLGQTTMAGSLPVTIASNQSNLPNNIVQFGGTALSTGIGAGGAGIPRVTVSNDSTIGLVAGTAVVGKVGIDQTTPGTTNAVQPIPGASGGTSIFSEIVAANTTSVAVDANPGQIYGIRVFSNNTTIVYGKLYNTAQASTTCGAGTPRDRFEIPAQTGGSGFVVPISYGETFSTAITLCVTGGIADTDATAPAASSYLVSIDYK